MTRRAEIENPGVCVCGHLEKPYHGKKGCSACKLCHRYKTRGSVLPDTADIMRTSALQREIRGRR